MPWAFAAIYISSAEWDSSLAIGSVSRAFEFDSIWQNANDSERRVIVEELIEAVTIHADRHEVTVTGAPPILIELDEVGLRPASTGSAVSEGGRERSQLTTGSPIGIPCRVQEPPRSPTSEDRRERSQPTTGWRCGPEY